MHVDIGKRVLHFQLHEYCVFILKQTLELLILKCIDEHCTSDGCNSNYGDVQST